MNAPSPVNILFVEDSEDDVELALRAMKRDGIEALWRRVQTERDMRAMLAELKPDAILSDFSMPGFDGLLALRLAKEIVPEVPFIFLSGTIGEERAIEAIRLGATDYVLKNNMRRLATSVKRALVEAADRARVAKAEEERRHLVEILEATSDYVGMSDPQGRQIYVNAGGRRLLGARADGIIGAPILEIYPPWARELIENEARPAALRDGVWEGETAILDGGGQEVPISQVIIAHRTDEGEVRFYSTIARDISERKAYEARLKYLANYDALSGLPNRALLGDRASQSIGHARRTGRSCGLVVLNIDRFKLLNESYGHGVGDALVKQVGERLAQSIREGDTVARLGADDFAVLATDLARPDDVVYVARKIRDSFAAPFRVDEREMHVTLSIGASTYPRDGEEFDLLLRNADAAMHRVKQQGGNAFQFYAAAMTSEAVTRIEIESALRAAIAQKQLELHYQPQVDLRDGRIVGLEALMRWRHPERGYVSPALFIPIAEESDLIQPLGAWALMEAARTMAAWHQAGHQVRVAVNVSARQFRSSGFVEAVGRALRAHAIAPQFLEIELTESALIEDRDRAAGILGEMKRLGVQVAVDDFGTGYSSLSYLSGLPVDCLKIDRAFVMNAGKGGRDAAIAQAIVSLGHTLGLSVVAEGVETAEQLSFLRAHRCDIGQGYLFAKPMPPDGAASALATRFLGEFKKEAR
ncbi:MAG TPA: EAL domain-containing protein [Burkholderiales bacterium]|nr:EAL domain-containing protein [Burkholderiales bacterium]